MGQRESSGVNLDDLTAVETTSVAVETSGTPSVMLATTPSAESDLPRLLLKSTTQPVVTIANVKPKHLGEVDKIATEIGFDDSNKLIVFGEKPQENLKAKLREILGDAKVRDFGAVGDVVLQLDNTMKHLKAGELKAELVRADPENWKSMMAGLPIIGKYFSALSTYLARREKIVEELRVIEEQAKTERRRILEGNAKLDVLFKEIEGNFYALGVYIVGGEKALLRGQTEFEALRKKAAASGNALDATAVVTFHENLMAFDDTLVQLKMAYVRAPITAQRIRLIQKTARDQMKQITFDLNFTMTQLMEGLIQLNTLLDIARSQANSKERSAAAGRIADFADDMLAITTEAAHKNRMDVIKQVEALEASSQKVIEFTKRRAEMDREAQAANHQADEMLRRIQTDFREGLRQIAEENPSASVASLSPAVDLSK
jgi:uncharacterized protein YaaN involved in tellurite resistance